MSRTALVVIDVQLEYFDGTLPIMAPPRDHSLERIGAAMDAATAHGVPVIVVRHSGAPGEGSFEPGTATWELHPDIGRRPRDLLVDKTLPGTFTGTPLGGWLTEHDIDHLTIVGYMTNVCCDTTARQALHLGLGATILRDAVGVPDMPDPDGAVVPAVELQRAALAPLALIGVGMSHVDQWIDALD